VCVYIYMCVCVGLLADNLGGFSSSAHCDVQSRNLFVDALHAVEKID